MNDISKELKLFARSRCKEDTATFRSQLRVQRAILRGDFRSLQKDLGDEIGSVRNLTFPDFCSHQEHSVTTYKNQLVLSKPETLIPFKRKCSFRSLAFQPLYSESTFNLKEKDEDMAIPSKPVNRLTSRRWRTTFRGLVFSHADCLVVVGVMWADMTILTE
ncbi:hypothetical protein F2Q68_00043537 [Brassica cretica]|uniref:Uncharacterized protein n=1 Tax=Brassica cretica TaxID=69181 RepID=A0A8S9LUL5_BRACR|nr:hypothetical protein F2Q68_00043537 [Brassica cretica]